MLQSEYIFRLCKVVRRVRLCSLKTVYLASTCNCLSSKIIIKDKKNNAFIIILIIHDRNLCPL